MPRRLQRAAIAAFAEFGRVSRIVATTPATLHDRPGRDLWAVLVRGRFEYTGPLPLLRDTPAPPSGRTGAAVVTDRGEVVRIGLWGANAKQENPVWERVFREDYPAGNP